MSGILSACASWQGGKTCAAWETVPSFFAQGQQLAAFETVVRANGYEGKGILQIRRLAPSQYQITAFTLAGGYRLLEADVTEKHIRYSFLIKQADRAQVRAGLRRLWVLLLFQPTAAGECKSTDTGKVHLYKHPYPVQYLFAHTRQQPVAAQYKTFLQEATLEYVHYAQPQIPDKLLYRDGPVEMSLQLIRNR